MNTKNPNLAGLLNLVFPGLGVAYVGERGRMVAEYLEVVLFMLFWIFGALLLSLLGNSQSLLYFNLGIVFLYGLAMFSDGREVAQTHNQKMQTK